MIGEYARFIVRVKLLTRLKLLLVPYTHVFIAQCES